MGMWGQISNGLKKAIEAKALEIAEDAFDSNYNSVHELQGDIMQHMKKFAGRGFSEGIRKYASEQWQGEEEYDDDDYDEDDNDYE